VKHFVKRSDDPGPDPARQHTYATWRTILKHSHLPLQRPDAPVLHLHPVTHLSHQRDQLGVPFIL